MPVEGQRRETPPTRGYAPGERWRKRLAYEWRKLMRLRATPHEVALGCAAGVFAACTPFLGFQMALAGCLALLMRASIPAAMLGTFIGNPVSWPAIWSASYVSGAWILGHDPAHAATAISDGVDALGQTIVAPSTEALDAAVGNLSPILEPLTVGGVLIGLILAAGSYYPMRRAVRAFQKRHNST